LTQSLQRAGISASGRLSQAELNRLLDGKSTSDRIGLKMLLSQAGMMPAGTR
jgi:hypothetical protein